MALDGHQPLRISRSEPPLLEGLGDLVRILGFAQPFRQLADLRPVAAPNGLDGGFDVVLRPAEIDRPVGEHRPKGAAPALVRYADGACVEEAKPLVALVE